MQTDRLNSNGLKMAIAWFKNNSKFPRLWYIWIFSTYKLCFLNSERDSLTRVVDIKFTLSQGFQIQIVFVNNL